MNRYVRPQIIATFDALSQIKSDKGVGFQEGGSIYLTNGAAYQADE